MPAYTVADDFEHNQSADGVVKVFVWVTLAVEQLAYMRISVANVFQRGLVEPQTVVIVGVAVVHCPNQRCINSRNKHCVFTVLSHC